MSAAEATKPAEVETPVAPVVPAETAPVVAPVEPEVKPTEAVEAAKPAEETPKVEGEAPVAAEEKKEEEKKEEKKEEKPVEPIYSGALGYKAPGLKNIFRFSKKYFWFGEEAAVPTSSLSQYLRGEKAEVAHPTAAWSSITGKGLLFFVKHADQKETPAGVLNLADATELSKDGVLAFHFKLNGDKHTFEASSAAERNGWFIAVEKAIEEAKAAKEGIVSSEAYKEEVKKLAKPTTLAPAAAPSAPKKSTEVTPKPAEGEASAAAVPTEEVEAPARTGSASSSSDNEDKKKKASKSKSRSVSRGKRASIFGTFLGKKDKAEEKVEEKKEEKAEEEAKKEEPAVAEASTEPATAAPVTEETPKPVEETKPEEALTATPAVEEKKAEEKPKPTKRASIFGNFVEKLKSPTHEKKEPELATPAKESEVSAEAPKIEETPKVEDAPLAPVMAVVDGTSEAPKTEEAKPATATTPAKEKQHFSFGKFLGGAKEKVKSPTTEKTPEAPKTEEAPKVEETAAPVEAAKPEETAAPVATEPATEAAKEETPATEGAATTTPPAKKRGSLFGLGGSVKKEKDGEEKSQGLKGLFRNASKAGKSKKEKEPANTPAKVEETAEPVEEKTEAAPVAESKETPAVAAPTEQATIGDVVPDAVTVGQEHKSAPAVTSSA